MKITCAQITESLQIVPMTPDAALVALNQATARVWIDLEAPGPDELAPWLDKIGVTQLSRRLCLEARDRAGFYPLRRELLLVTPVLAKQAEGAREVDYVAWLCRENVLVTVHRAPFLNRERMAEMDDAETWLPEPSIAGLVSAMMIELSLDCLHHTARIRAEITELEDRMDRDPESVEADELLDMRTELLSVQSVVNDQLPSAQALNTTDKPFFALSDGRDYKSCAVANLEAGARSLVLMDRRLAALRSGFQMYSQDKTNRRLGMLTVLSAIFMPITLMAGIWGMNFEHMPEFKLTYGYPMALGVMALVATGMFLFFRRNDWFG